MTAASRPSRLRRVLARALDPLGHRLMLLFGLLVLPPTVVSVVSSLAAHNQMLARMRENAEHFALLASTYERTLIDQSQNLLETVAGAPAFRSLQAVDAVGPECDRQLRAAIEPYRIYASLVLLRPDGAVRCRSDPMFAREDASSHYWFSAVLRNRTTFLSGLVVLRGPELPVIILARPLPQAGAEVEGVLALSIDLAKLQPFERFQGLPAGGVIYLLDRYGVVLTGLERPLGPSEAGMPALSMTELIDGHRRVTFDGQGYDGIDRYYAVTPMRSGALFILVGLPIAEATGWLRQDLSMQLSGILAMWAAGLLAAWLGTRVIVTRWTGRLTDTAREMSKGNLSARADLDGAPVEIRRVGDTLGEMAARLAAQHRDLENAIEEKDTLLREIHHRVKNNLQTVISLLNLQTKGIRLDSARVSLQQLKMRIQTLGLVHRHLYESESLKLVDLRSFLGELCRLLQDATGAPYWRVRVDLDIARVSLQIERAIPLALLVTELVTNSFKHAFPDGRSGTIAVKLALEGDNLRLTVADDGVGNAPQANDGADDRSGLGLVLMQALAKQLNGELSTAGALGTTTTVTFPLVAPPSMPAAEFDSGTEDAAAATGAPEEPAKIRAS